MTSIADRFAFYTLKGMSPDSAAKMVELEAVQTQIPPANLATLLHPIYLDPPTVTYILVNYGSELSAICVERDKVAAKLLYERALKRMKTTTKRELVGKIQGLSLDGDHPYTSTIKIAFEGTTPKLLKLLTDADVERIEKFPVHGFNHDSIVQYSIVSAHGKQYMLMEYLTTVLDQLPTFSSVNDCNALCGCVLSGLKYLHDCGYGHFDVKGSNICITSFGSFKLIDLGSTALLGSRSFATTESHVPSNMKNRVGDVYEVSVIHDYFMLACTILYKAHLLPIPVGTTQRHTTHTIITTLQQSIYCECEHVRELLRLLSPSTVPESGVLTHRGTTLPPIHGTLA